MGYRKWWGLVASVVLVSACYGAMTPKAENNRGDIYYYGQGVPKNYQKAVYWYRKAARQGNAYAQFNLGVAYYYGQGVPKNYQKAVYWYRKAAVQGYANAELGMGIAYQRGHGVRPDYVQAYKWYALAKAQPGFETPAAVSMTLENLMQHMSPAQIARAQSMAAAWEKAHGH